MKKLALLYVFIVATVTLVALSGCGCRQEKSISEKVFTLFPDYTPCSYGLSEKEEIVLITFFSRHTTIDIAIELKVNPFNVNTQLPPSFTQLKELLDSADTVKVAAVFYIGFQQPNRQKKSFIDETGKITWI